MAGAALGAVLDRLRTPVLPPKLEAARVRYRFTLDGGRSLDVVLQGGRLSLADPQEPADCVVECTSEELEALLSGRHNLLTAFMRGDVRVLGTFGAAKSLHTYLRYAHLEEAKE
jgi:putative sterol carrier protein